MSALIAAGLIGFLIGCVFISLVAAVSDAHSDKCAEKSGVWKSQDRAYKLTRIEP